MARGHQKIQSQKKAQEKASSKNKQNSTIKQTNKALVFSCTVCKVSFLFLLSNLIVFMYYIIYMYIKVEMF